MRPRCVKKLRRNTYAQSGLTGKGNYRWDGPCNQLNYTTEVQNNRCTANAVLGLVND
jgi:hypothetical protein